MASIEIVELAAVVSAVCGCICAWLHARRVRLSVGEVEAAAQNVKEIEKLLKLAVQFRRQGPLVTFEPHRARLGLPGRGRFAVGGRKACQLLSEPANNLTAAKRRNTCMRIFSDQRDKIERSLKLASELERSVTELGLPASTLRIELGLAISQAKAILEHFHDRR